MGELQGQWIYPGLGVQTGRLRVERKKWVHYDVRAVWCRENCLMLNSDTGLSVTAAWPSLCQQIQSMID